MPIRLYQQDRKLADQFGRENLKSKVIEKGDASTSESKAAETAKLEEHLENTARCRKVIKEALNPKEIAGDDEY
ncbi:hypothetical protein U737_22305 [Methylomonas sp. LW13]|uniref:hypothetical protein n=1 Tax=Methylomonas sp. WH-1 TaxID=2815719 RepID=UPI00051BD66D|nr:hypothetical protein CWO84_13535 [Methylomonas sp. Kb3]QBC29427.1 hypothetical protein U737_22305 [Methylomonas sp. LW13]